MSALTEELEMALNKFASISPQSARFHHHQVPALCHNSVPVVEENQKPADCLTDDEYASPGSLNAMFGQNILHNVKLVSRSGFVCIFHFVHPIHSAVKLPVPYSMSDGTSTGRSRILSEPLAEADLCFRVMPRS